MHAPAWPKLAQITRAKAGGEAGIRTLGTAFRPYNGLANRRLQPLGHLTTRLRRDHDVARATPARKASISAYEIAVRPRCVPADRHSDRNTAAGGDKAMGQDDARPDARALHARARDGLRQRLAEAGPARKADRLDRSQELRRRKTVLEEWSHRSSVHRARRTRLRSDEETAARGHAR